MKKICIVIILFLAFLCINAPLGYSEMQAQAPVLSPVVKTLDINNDGKTEVIYHSDDGKNVSKVEADTNADGKPDITVEVNDGKFQSAQVDENYDGKVEKKFSTPVEFGKWLDKNHPDYSDKLNRKDWTVKALKF
jgi:hypothetical protein